MEKKVLNIKLPKCALAEIDAAAKRAKLKRQVYMKMAARKLANALNIEGDARFKSMGITYDAPTLARIDKDISHVCVSKSSFFVIASLLYAKKIKLDYEDQNSEV